jgi:hypothetical protein
MGQGSRASWPIAEDRYAGSGLPRRQAPALIVGNYFDGITDYAGALSSAALLPDSRLLTYAGWGHRALGVTPCVTDHVIAYLLYGTLAPEGTVCAAAPNPFVAIQQKKARAAAGALRGSSVRAWLSRPLLQASA